MALRLRRGTNAERLTIIPQEGELIYTTDTKELYAGDGTTVGGNRITGATDGSPAALTQDLDLDSNNITGIGNININGTVTADFNGDIIGSVLGDIQGSVFGDDSTTLVDSVNNFITGNVDNSNVDTARISITNTGANTSLVNIIYASDSDLIADTTVLGALSFNRSDPINGTDEVARVTANIDAIQLWHSNSQAYGVENNWVTFKNTNFGIGYWNPTVTLDVNGPASVNGYVQFGSLTTIERDALTPANGMVIYNSTNNKFEGYQNGGWINLDDGTAAS